MNENILNSLMQLYALIVYANREAEPIIARSFVESYLKKFFSRKIITAQLAIFDFHLEDISEKEKHAHELQTKFSVLVLKICEEINKELHQKQKLPVLINLLQFIKHWKSFTQADFTSNNFMFEIIETVAIVFKFEQQEFNDIKAFIFEQIHHIHSKTDLLIIHDNPDLPVKSLILLEKKGLNGVIYVFRIQSTNTFLFRYIGSEKPEMNSRTVFPHHVYILEKGFAIKGENFEPVFYSDIVNRFLLAENKMNIQLQVKQIAFYFPGSENGIHPLSFSVFSGQMIGIMGGSGTGKSTLLNILNGNLKPNEGNVLLNGFDLHSQREKIEGIVGYIPQDDLLIEELTVFQNMFFNAKLCFGNLPDEQIESKVNIMLKELDLWDVKDLKVGNPLNKFISGGQRKRLNISLELIREPYVLFVDEPTSGLSSTDSERVIDLLKEKASTGKLVVVNIHQPSSTIFKQFDKLIVLDKGGFPVYFGDPVDAVFYVKTQAKLVDAAESECPCCGNVNPDAILETIELRDIDEHGNFSPHRKISPKKWYEEFLKNINPEIKKPFVTVLPKVGSKIPGLIKQWIIFSKRNLFAKLSDKQYLLIGLLISPLLALILSFLSKYFSVVELGHKSYVFSENENIPAFIFMSIIVSLFVGLTVSAEEIIRDRKILSREKFLNLSWFSYMNSKVAFLIILSAIQAFSYVLIGNYTLGIKGMHGAYFLVLFSASCFANLTGLNISSAFKSVVTIYVLIPLILVPQILLSGVIVKYDKLHYAMASNEYVPVVGDLMASRWAYEALMVHQFKNNKYQQHFYDISKDISDASFKINYVITELQLMCNKFLSHPENYSDAHKTLFFATLKSELDHLIDMYNLKQPAFYNNLASGKITEKEIKAYPVFLAELKQKLIKYNVNLISEKDSIYMRLEEKTGKEEILHLKKNFHNERVAEFVLNNREMKRIKRTEKKLIQVYEPIYLTPTSKVGRAHFYAPEKFIGPISVSTLYFNVLALWIMSLILYIALYFKILARIINALENKFKKRRQK